MFILGVICISVFISPTSLSLTSPHGNNIWGQCHRQQSDSTYWWSSYLGIHLLPLDLGQCNAWEVHAVCKNGKRRVLLNDTPADAYLRSGRCQCSAEMLGLSFTNRCMDVRKEGRQGNQDQSRTPPPLTDNHAWGWAGGGHFSEFRGMTQWKN